MKASLFTTLLTATVFNLSAATAGTAPDMERSGMSIGDKPIRQPVVIKKRARRKSSYIEAEFNGNGN